eukprot:ANDGO_06671.mRNA.1 Anthranilate N-benzoyltransferase protein 3
MSAADHSVTVLARYTLNCANKTSLETVESPMHLGPLDQVVLSFVPIAVVFVYRPSVGSPSELIPIERLQRALALLLDYYPHLTGRFSVNQSDQSPEITQLGTGAELLSATCSANLNDLSVFHATVRLQDLPDAGNALLAPFDPDPDRICKDPIFTVQHTRFVCGSVSLGIRLHHRVCDADGYFQLVRDLAELYRGVCMAESTGASVQLAHMPQIRSYMWELHRMTPEERRQALQFEPSLFRLVPNLSTTFAASGASSRPPVVGRILRFSTSELNDIKAHATEMAGCSWISTFDALSAHLYQRVYIARVKHSREFGGLPNESQVSGNFLASVNWRGTDRLNLPRGYFPNAVFCPYFSLSPDVLACAPLSQIARVVHDSLRQPSKEQAVQTIRWIAAQPDKSCVLLAFPFETGGFMVSQWCKFDMYVNTHFDVDAVGQPIAPALVCPPFTPISLVDGLAYFLATEDQFMQASQQNGRSAVSTGKNTSAIDVSLSLSEPIWHLLDKDPEFRRFQL